MGKSPSDEDEDDSIPLENLLTQDASSPDHGVGCLTDPDNERRFEFYYDATPDHSVDRPIVVVNDTDWYRELPEGHINGEFPALTWKFHSEQGLMFSEWSDLSANWSRLDYFLSCFPYTTLENIVKNTNIKLTDKGLREIDMNELLKFFGIMILMTGLEFHNTLSLWDNNHNPSMPYIKYGRFTKLVTMSPGRFDDILMCLRFSHQPVHCPVEMTAEQYQWSLVDDFIDQFNMHRLSCMVPCHMVCYCFCYALP